MFMISLYAARLNLLYIKERNGSIGTNDGDDDDGDDDDDTLNTRILRKCIIF
jgi:hypothetical protein